MNTPAGFEPAFAFTAEPSEDAVCFVWRNDRILARPGDPPTLPRLRDLTRLSIDGARHYLGRLDGVECVAIRTAAEAPDAEGWEWRGLRSLFLQLPDVWLALAGRASQIVEWDRSHQFCGRCGTPTRDREGERAKECPACGYIVYPRVSPAMMVLVTRGKELLLARSKRFPQPIYSALAGFVEAGESIEDCIHREVREEVGIDVHNLRYVASQSWPFPHSLMIAYNAEYAGGEVRPCDDEIVDARWFKLDELPNLPNPISIARALIDSTIERLKAGLIE
jgi:NAD+ diphosphatase